MVAKSTAQIHNILESITDPEIPVLTISDLGILRGVRLDGDSYIIQITPTYSGCPAMDMITVNIKAALEEHGITNARVELILKPAWTTDWLSEQGRAKLKAYGIAPPIGSASKLSLIGHDVQVKCPQCNSENTKRISEFGSTACKALYKCKDCLEPFDYFKCI